MTGEWRIKYEAFSLFSAHKLAQLVHVFIALVELHAFDYLWQTWIDRSRAVNL